MGVSTMCACFSQQRIITCIFGFHFADNFVTSLCLSYPQPPLQDRLSRPVSLDIPGAVELGTMGIGQINEDTKATRVHCLSNPCTFKINEVVFGVTSTDVLFQISSEETNSNLEPGSRLRRIAQHMLQQRSYYPLFPPPPSFPTNLDLKRMENWKMPCMPDVLIAPSRLTCFATSILDSTVFVNPGHLTRGTTGGTYAMMEIQPIKRETLDESGGDDVRLQHGVPDRIAVEIKRI
jgi:DNA polymerase alpha subunit B